MDNKDKSELDQLFAAVRDTALPDTLSRRIIGDADRVQTEFMANAASDIPSNRSRAGILSQLSDLLGGWPTLGGLVTACAAGLWIGLAPPDFLPDPAGMVLGQGYDLDLMDIGSSDSIDAEEG